LEAELVGGLVAEERFSARRRVISAGAGRVADCRSAQPWSCSPPRAAVPPVGPFTPYWALRDPRGAAST